MKCIELIWTDGGYKEERKLKESAMMFPTKEGGVEGFFTEGGEILAGICGDWERRKRGRGAKHLRVSVSFKAPPPSSTITIWCQSSPRQIIGYRSVEKNLAFYSRFPLFNPFLHPLLQTHFPFLNSHPSFPPLLCTLLDSLPLLVKPISTAQHSTATFHLVLSPLSTKLSSWIFLQLPKYSLNFFRVSAPSTTDLMTLLMGVSTY